MERADYNANSPINRNGKTYYGALNLLTHEFHWYEASAGNDVIKVTYTHKDANALSGTRRYSCSGTGRGITEERTSRSFSRRTKGNLAEADWKVTCMRFAPNTPGQNLTDGRWGKGKTHLRKQFASNKTFAQVKRCFSTFLNSLRFTSTKLSWYWPNGTNDS